MNPAGGAQVRLTEVTKRYRIGPDSELVATDAVSLTIDAGSTVALAGASGSGKSTLLHLIGAMDLPDEGSVMVDDLELADLSRRRLAEYRRSVGFVFQRFHLLPALSVEDNVLAPLLPYRAAFDLRQRARELLEAVGSPNGAARCPRACRVVNSSAWPLHARSSTDRGSCWPTNPLATSTRPPVPKSSTCS